MTADGSAVRQGGKAAHKGGRFDWLERPNDDFPFYNDHPVGLNGWQWGAVLLGVATGFAVLIAPPPFLNGSMAGFVPAIAFSAIPLAVLAWAVGHHWKALFRRLRGMDFVWMVAFFVLNWIVTLAAGWFIVNHLDTVANPAAHAAVDVTAVDRVLFFARTGIQLFGEEVFTILPFLAILAFCHGKLGLSRRGAIILAWLGSAVLFGLAHLPTYDWHVAQALIGVGTARLVLTLPYIMTKNLWVSTGAHILNDWAIFGLPLLLGSAAA